MLRGAKKNGAVFTANSRYKSTEPWHSAALYKGEGAYTQRPVLKQYLLYRALMGRCEAPRALPRV